MSMAVASSPHLLVVEDDPDLLGLIHTMLEGEGYSVTAAASLPESLAALEEHLFQFVLTDLFREPEQRHPLQSIQPLIEQATPTPVGVMTAWRVPEDDVTQANLAFVLPKPFELDDLLGQLDAHLHPTISSIRQTQMVEQFYLALNAHDWQRLTRLCAQNVKVITPVVVSGSRVGLRSYLATLERRFNALPGYTIEEARIFPRQDGAAARYLARWQGSDGKEHRAAGAMRFRFQHGRIAQIEGAF